MKRFLWAITAALLSSATLVAQAQEPVVPQVRVWAAACMACHGTAGRAQPGMVSLAGMNADVMVQTMLDYKHGRRAGTVMPRLAQGYNEEQIRAIANYFAAQKP